LNEWNGNFHLFSENLKLSISEAVTGKHVFLSSIKKNPQYVRKNGFRNLRQKKKDIFGWFQNLFWIFKLKKN
jgi:hypothetical protein